jgi:predicted secreted protein
MKRLLALPLLLAAALPAQAQTVLHLAETARVNVHPDELAATLKVGAASLSAAEAQNRVNTNVAKALDQAKSVASVIATTGNYQVWHSTQPDQWNAEQTIDLRGRDGAQLLRLVGLLQSQGLTLSRLGWRVAADTARTAKSEATKQALANLRSRADEASAIVGLRFQSFRDIRLDGAPPNTGPMPRMMAAATAGAMPNAEADDVSVEATVEADIILQPGPTASGKTTR